ncbi:MAG: TrbC/VIRB2 family protein [Alphaproteobacteria bacterium]|nr:TrbC/VIRB2 family protein [Alphaproteobacteria bacterium]
MSFKSTILSLMLAVCGFFSLSCTSISYASDTNDGLMVQCDNQSRTCEETCTRDNNTNGGNNSALSTCLSNCHNQHNDCLNNAESSSSGGDALSDTLCCIIALLLGVTGRVIATIAIFFGGVATFLGKMNWGTALVICLSITGMFGAVDVVKWFTGYQACEGYTFDGRACTQHD